MTSNLLRRSAGVVVLGLALSAPGQTGRGPLLRATDLQQDAKVLRSAYEQMHPGLYRYSSVPEMNARFEALDRSLDHDQTLADAYLAFSTFAGQVRCGHTYANFFNQPKDIAETLFKGQTRVPFYFVWLDRRMIVTRDFTPDHQFPVGTRINAINGVSTSTILARLLTVARADGSNDAKRVALLNVTGDSRFETFDIFFPLFFPQTSPNLRIQAVLPDAHRPVTLQATALTYEERLHPIQEKEAAAHGGDAIQFEWKELPGEIAYLSMPNWALYDSKWDWKSWLNARLDELTASPHKALVLDLRGNEGGEDIGNVILARLIDKPLALASMRRLVRYRSAPKDLLPYLDTWDPSFRDWGTSAVDLPTPWPTAPPVPYLRLTRYDDDDRGDVIQPAGKRFAGKVFVLIDANNSSATFQFAQVIQQNHLGQLVGEPTGGSQRGINGGAFFFLRLPHSHIEMDLPLIGTFPTQPAPDAGLRPDIFAAPTPASLIARRDVALEAVKAQLR